MGDDKATREKLLDSAKHEFLEKGYMKASLRTICKNAGVTTGALYFFFQDKEDLLKQLVEEPLKGLALIVKQHLSEELEMESPVLEIDADSRDIAAAREIVQFMYLHYDVFLILLTKSQGSAYEDIVSRFADWGENHYNMLVERLSQKCGVPKPEHYVIHWMTHMQIDAFTHLLTHEPDEKKAVRHIEEIVVFLLSGWNGLILGKR